MTKSQEPHTCSRCEAEKQMAWAHSQRADAAVVSADNNARWAHAAEVEVTSLREALRVIYTGLRDDKSGEFWSARRWLDERDVFNDNLNGERILLEVAKFALKDA